MQCPSEGEAVARQKQETATMPVFQCSISHCCVQLQSSSSSDSLVSPEVLGFPSSLSYFSTHSLLSPLTLNCVLSFTSMFEALRVVLYRPRSLLWGPGLCVGWWGNAEGRRAAPWTGPRLWRERGSEKQQSLWGGFGTAPTSAFLGGTAHSQASLCLATGAGHPPSLPGDFLSWWRL